MANIVPDIGVNGVFSLKEPFNNLLIKDIGYTCTAVRQLTDIIKAGGDPQALYYTPYNLDSTIYNADVKNNVCIVSLQSSKGGDTVYVPSSYVLSFPKTGGIPYTVTGLGISLGAIPDGLDLTYLKSRIQTVVKDTLGLVSDVEIKTLALSETTLVNQDSHNALETARKNNIADTQTDYSKLLAVTKKYQEAVKKIRELENFIISKNL